MNKGVIKRTVFYDQHVKAQAKLVPFAGWEMPLHYGSQLHEHHQVRNAVGMFDVSHMGIIDIKGADARKYLRFLLANDIDRLQDGKALYTCLLNEQGGVIDDLIVYRISPSFYRLVVNAGTREKDLAWMKLQAKKVEVDIMERADLAMLALQGPEAKTKLPLLFPAEQRAIIQELASFSFVILGDYFVARTGYTGEDGYEIIFPTVRAKECWQDLLALDVAPCGLGARDTLRLEAGLNLYGADMDESVTPLESNLAWTVALEDKERLFIGRKALETQMQAGITRRLTGLILRGKGVIRDHQKVMMADHQVGEITSGGYSPTLEQSIALARVPMQIGEHCFIEIRQQLIPADVIKPPFVRRVKKQSFTE